MNDGGDTKLSRGRLLRLGAQTLETAEILTLLLGDGPSVESIVGRLLRKFRNLHTLARCSPAEFASVKGMSLERAVRLTVAFELTRRVSKEILFKVKIDNPKIICQLMAQDFRSLSQESLRVVLLDTKYQLLHIAEVSLGSLSESIAHPREILRPALIYPAYAMILVHNHPSGDPTPSVADKKLTRRISEAGTLMGIELADHIIIGHSLADKESYFSFKEAKLL